MGGSESSEIKTEEKAIDSMGHVNNNIVVQGARDNHQQVIVSERLLIATYLLVCAEVIKLLIYFYSQCRSNLKKRYGGKPATKPDA